MNPRLIRMAMMFGLASCALAAALPAQVFRSTTEVVLVDVVVRDGNRFVKGLSASDFVLYDAGLPQRIDQVSVEQLPIDLTILLDTSGSTTVVTEQFRRDAGRVASFLRADDHARLMAFATGVTELIPIGQPFHLADFSNRAPSGGTSLFDALVLTMARRTEPGRRHLIVAFTDGEDTNSVSDASDVRRTAGASDSVLHLVVPSTSLGRGGALPRALQPVHEAVDATGGTVAALSGNAVDALGRIFDEFRQSYVIRYTPTWKSLSGWHALSVRVTRPGVSVRARRGYYRP
jgi:Ca-activated chloride channel family protein